MKKIELKNMEKLDYARNEAYKSLRTNIRFCGDDIQTILLTSCTPNEGKSTVSFNLAKALADDGKKVLLIDSDMRKSVLASRLGATEKDGKKIFGLSHFLTGQNEIGEVLCNTDVSGLYMIFAGPEVPNPTELLGNDYFMQLMDAAKKQFDYIIIDAPPLGSVIDAAILTPVCDGAIMVVECNAISYRMAQTIKKQLSQTGVRLLGAILNKVDLKKGSYYQGYYHGYGYYKKAYKGYKGYGSYEKY